MVSQARKVRGRESEHAVAGWYQDHGFPNALAVGAGRPGVDITGVPGLAIEVKARAKFEPLAWLRQATKLPRVGLPFAVFRCNGQGPQNVGEWGVLMTMSDHTQLLREAGYISDAE